MFKMFYCETLMTTTLHLSNTQCYLEGEVCWLSRDRLMRPEVSIMYIQIKSMLCWAVLPNKLHQKFSLTVRLGGCIFIAACWPWSYGSWRKQAVQWCLRLKAVLSEATEATRLRKRLVCDKYSSIDLIDHYSPCILRCYKNQYIYTHGTWEV